LQIEFDAKQFWFDKASQAPIFGEQNGRYLVRVDRQTNMLTPMHLQ
jgi:hypothetical protein